MSDIMKKFVIGVMVGIAITASATAYGEEVIDSIIGKTIDGSFPVKIEGKTLEVQAAVIEGTSYLPVRAMGDALGLDVSFDADLGIELKQKEVQSVEGEVQTTQPTKEEIQAIIDAVQNKNNRILEIQKEETKLIEERSAISRLIREYEVPTNFKLKEKDDYYYEQRAIYDEKAVQIEALRAELAELQKQ